jgi:hypothetical protein
MAPASSGVFHLTVKDGIAIWAGLFHGFGFTRQNYLLFTNSHSY